jgi:C1A family cysteine protease
MAADIEIQRSLYLSIRDQARKQRSELFLGRFSPSHEHGTGGIAPSAEELQASLSIAPLSSRPVDTHPHIVQNLPPVRSQYARGTCVPFAFTALNEHALRKRGVNVDLSQQHLYWECQQIDDEGCDGGAQMWAAAQIISQTGQCTAATSQYRTQICDNNIGVDVSVARREAAKYKLVVREINPRDLDGIIGVLQRGWPVVILMDTYVGWDNEDVYQTGEMTMPPSQTFDVCHAVCLIGVQDNPLMGASRGKFLFRNSWGPQFGVQTSLGNIFVGGQGNGTMPIEYAVNNFESAWVTSDTPS